MLFVSKVLNIRANFNQSIFLRIFGVVGNFYVFYLKLEKYGCIPYFDFKFIVVLKKNVYKWICMTLVIKI